MVQVSALRISQTPIMQMLEEDLAVSLAIECMTRSPEMLGEFGNGRSCEGML